MKAKAILKYVGVFSAMAVVSAIIGFTAQLFGLPMIVTIILVLFASAMIWHLLTPDDDK